MQLKNYLLIVLLSTLVGSSTFGQDFHYTQNFFTPLDVNPALAGAFNGSYRINGVYRDQFRGAAERAFSGFTFNIDAPIIRGIRKQDWVGIGIRYNQDQSGFTDQKMTYFGLGASYHLALDKKQTSIVSLGAQYGTGGITYAIQDNSSFGSFLAVGQLSVAAEQFNMPSGGGGGGGGTPSLEGGSLNDLSVGLLYNSKNPKSENDLKIGLAVEGILAPNRADIGRDNKGIGINAFGSYDYAFTKRSSLTSGIYLYTQKSSNAVNISGILNHRLKPGDEMTLHAGLGVRNVRAGLVFLGATIKGIRVGLGYDQKLQTHELQ